MTSAIDNEPSLRYAVGTFAALLGIPITAFGIAPYLSSLSSGQFSWVVAFIAYLTGTLPGVVLGVRYLSSRNTKIAFGISYAFVCIGLLFVEPLLISCFFRDVCL